MQKVLHETCEQYVARRLSEGWRIISQDGFNVVLQSPEGIIRPVDLRNDVETLRPNAAGDETSITSQYPNSTEHWDKVDEASADDDATTVYTISTTYKRDLYKFPAHSVGSGTINSVTIYFRNRGSDTGYDYTAYIKPSQKSGTTVTDGTEVLRVKNLYGTSHQHYTTNPATGLPYTWAEIDVIQVGICLRTDNASYTNYCTQVYVEVDYTPAFTPFRSYYPHILAH